LSIGTLPCGGIAAPSPAFYPSAGSRTTPRLSQSVAPAAAHRHARRDAFALGARLGRRVDALAVDAELPAAEIINSSVMVSGDLAGHAPEA